MELAGEIRTSDRRQGSSGEMYANQRHILTINTRAEVLRIVDAESANLISMGKVVI